MRRQLGFQPASFAFGERGPMLREVLRCQGAAPPGCIANSASGATICSAPSESSPNAATTSSNTLTSRAGPRRDFACLRIRSSNLMSMAWVSLANACGLAPALSSAFP
ncbi:MAG: hypothetical protein AB2A00_37730 [Myxococcota bacterium]